jgi:hypothetical protein
VIAVMPLRPDTASVILVCGETSMPSFAAIAALIAFLMLGQSSRCRLGRSKKGQAATRRQGRGKVPACGQHAPAQEIGRRS